MSKTHQDLRETTANGARTRLVMLTAEQCPPLRLHRIAHVGWADAGFLGDELSSTTYPNEVLLKHALANIRDGDILVAHLGIWSRKDPFWPMFDPLIAGLKAKGFCFATIPERKLK